MAWLYGPTAAGAFGVVTACRVMGSAPRGRSRIVVAMIDGGASPSVGSVPSSTAAATDGGRAGRLVVRRIERPQRRAGAGQADRPPEQRGSAPDAAATSPGSTTRRRGEQVVGRGEDARPGRPGRRPTARCPSSWARCSEVIRTAPSPGPPPRIPSRTANTSGVRSGDGRASRAARRDGRGRRSAA